MEVQTTRQAPAGHWYEALERAGIPAGPINSIADALADPQASYRAMLQEMDRFRLVASPLVIDRRRATADRPPPRLGEHTREILEEAG